MPKKKKHQRADGRFEYKCTVGHKLDGTAIRKSFYSTISLTDAKRQAEAYKREKAVSEAIGEPMTIQCVTFAEWAQKWLETYKKPFVTEATYKNTYVNCVKNHLIPYFGAANLSDIKPADIQQFFASKKQYSPSMLRKLRDALAAMFEAAIDNDLVYKNPCKRAIYKSEAEKHEKNALSDEQIEIVKQAADGVMDEVVFLLLTGLRRGEILGLMWNDIDLENATMNIQRSISMQYSTPVVRPPKWNSYRTIPLMPEAVELLQRQPRTSLYVFPAPDNTFEKPQNFARKMRKLMKTLPEECRCTPHELRHSYASQLMRRGVDIYTISKLLGHRDIKVTASVYVHPDIEKFREELKEKFCRQKVVKENSELKKL